MDKSVTGPPPKAGQLKTFLNKYRRSKDQKSIKPNQNTTEDIGAASSSSKNAPRNITTDLQHNVDTTEPVEWVIFILGLKEPEPPLIMVARFDPSSASSYITPQALPYIERHAKIVTIRPLPLEHQHTYRNPRLRKEYKVASSVEIGIANKFLKFTSAKCDVGILPALDEKEWTDVMSGVDLVLGRDFIERNGGQALLEHIAELHRANYLRNRASNKKQLITNVVQAEVAETNPQDVKTPKQLTIDPDDQPDVHAESSKKPEDLSLEIVANNTPNITAQKSVPETLTDTQWLMRRLDTSAARHALPTKPYFVTVATRSFMKSWR